MSNIKRFINGHPKEFRIGLIVIAIILVLIILYKSLFYSSAESAIYGIRLKNIKGNEISQKQKDELKTKALDIDGVTETRVIVKGRLLKYFITFEDGVSIDDIKTKITDVSNGVDEKIKGYYDITFYAEQNKDGVKKYPAIGYKHKTSDSVTFDTF